MPQARKSKPKQLGARSERIVQAFAQRLREMRHAAGMTQLELARQGQFNVSYVTRLENGQTAPGIDLVERLAKALGVSVNDLLPTDGADARSLLQDRARKRFEAVVTRAGTDMLRTLLPILAMMDETLGRERK